jgi:hypothetical protein
MVGACNTHGADDKRIQNISQKIWNAGDHLGELGVDGKIILQCILNKYDVMIWTGFLWLELGTSGEFL